MSERGIEFPLKLDQIICQFMPLSAEHIGCYVMISWFQYLHSERCLSDETCRNIVKAECNPMDWENVKKFLVIAGFVETEHGLSNPLINELLDRENESRPSRIRIFGRRFIDKWQQIRERIIERDNGVCVYCGGRYETMHVDHIIPLSRGGTNDDENLVTACPSCNLSKHAKTEQEWLQ